MKSKEAENTKKTLDENKYSFQKLQATAERSTDELIKKLIRENNSLDKQHEQYTKRVLAKRRILKIKGQLTYNCRQEDNAPEQVPVDGQVRAGTMVFMKNCASCHSLEAVDIRPMKGPSLGLIYNRRAGANTNFELYSKQLLQSTFFWSAKNLYRFMGNPSSFLPQTNCWLRKNPLHSEQDRADLITMFREFTGELVFNMRMKEIQRVGYTAYQTQLHVDQIQLQRANSRDKLESKIQNPF